MFGMFGGFKVVGQMASALEVDEVLYKAALTEAGVNYAHFKSTKKQLQKSGMTEREAIVELANMSLPLALDGLTLLERKFPGMPQVQTASEFLLSKMQSADSVAKKDSNEADANGNQAEEKMACTAAKFVSNQLLELGLRPTDVIEWRYGAGYVMGVAIEAADQLIQSGKKPKAFTWNFIMEMFGIDADRAAQYISSQEGQAKFEEACKLGRVEFASWLSSDYEFVPTGLQANNAEPPSPNRPTSLDKTSSIVAKTNSRLLSLVTFLVISGASILWFGFDDKWTACFVILIAMVLGRQLHFLALENGITSHLPYVCALNLFRVGVFLFSCAFIFVLKFVLALSGMG